MVHGRPPDVANWLAGCRPVELWDLAEVRLQAWPATGPDVHACLHDGHPTVCVQGIALGYINAFSTHVNVGFFHGSTLPDPDKLLLGNGRFMRHVKLTPSPGFDRFTRDALRHLMHAAYLDLKVRVISR